MKTNRGHSLAVWGTVLTLLFIVLAFALVAPCAPTLLAQEPTATSDRPEPGPERPEPGPGRDTPPPPTPTPGPTAPAGPESTAPAGPESTATATPVPITMPISGGSGGTVGTGVILLSVGLAFTVAGNCLAAIHRRRAR